MPPVYSERLIDLARSRGAEEAAAIRRSGELSANLYSGLGQQVAGSLREIAQMPAEARRAQSEQMRMAREEQTYQRQAQKDRQDAERVQNLNRLMTQYPDDEPPVSEVIRAMGPIDAQPVLKFFADRREASAKRGTAAVEAIGGYGPIAEDHRDDVMRSPQSGQLRYSFGPSESALYENANGQLGVTTPVSNGLEVMPNQAQQAKIAADAAAAKERADFKALMERNGGAMTPGGGAWMPPKPETVPNPTEWSVLMQAAGNDPAKALQLKEARDLRMREPKLPPAPPRMPSAMANDVATAQTSLAALDRLESLYNAPVNVNDPRAGVMGDRYVGPVTGFYNRQERKLPSIPGINVLSDAPQGFEDFSAETATLTNQVIQAITGAAVGVQEQGRIMQQIPTEDDPPPVWRAKAKATRRNLQVLIANKIRMGSNAQEPLAPGTTVDVNIPAAEKVIRVGPYTVREKP